MARHGDYLFRRNGRFYARLRVPRRLQFLYGQSDLRASLGTNEYGAARMRVLEVVLRWKRDFERARAMLDPHQVVAGSPILKGAGLISLGSAAREAGMAVADMLQEARNRGMELRLQATGWEGTDVPATDLEFDHDGSLILDCARHFPSSLIVGALYLPEGDFVVIAGGKLEACLFFRDKRRRDAVVFQLPGVAVPIDDVLIEKADAEAIRLVMAAGVSPAMLEVAGARAVPATAAHSAPPAHKYATMLASELVDRFLAAKAEDWGEATKIEMKGKCLAFVELMVNPTLADIDGALILDYRRRLLTLPQNIHLARLRLGVQSMRELAERSASLPKMKPERATAYLGRLSELFGWAVKHGFMPTNPAAGAMKRPRALRRKQDERAPMSSENLQKIFAVTWFQTGRGKRTGKGLHWSFMPSHYWLPQLALYSGGRLNELSQLYLDDIRQTPAGQWYVDFNMNRPDKLDVDEADKRLKTINSVRQVPVHSLLVSRGLIEYVKALREAGHERLFPELRFDAVAGYGKQASQFFNERFLGKRLKIVRDNTQTFHSFRHNFVTALMHLSDPPLSEFIVSQLAGHERGETMSGRRYAKDLEPDALAQHLERLAYDLPPIAPFDIADGLLAVEAALERKADLARAQIARGHT